MTPYITRMHRVTINILCLVNHLVTELFRDAIPNPLMWPVVVEEVLVFIKHILQSIQAQDDQMVKAFLAKTSNPTFGKRIGVGSLIRSFDRLESCAFQQAIKTFRIASIIVMKEKASLDFSVLAFPENMTGLLFQPATIG